MEQAKDYLNQNYSNISYLDFFKRFCATKNTAESIKFFKDAIDSLQASGNSDNEDHSVGVFEWCNSIKRDDYQVLQSDLLKTLWSLKNNASLSKNYAEQYQSDMLTKMANASSNVKDMGKNSMPPSLPPDLVARVERDPILFGSLSVSTIIKKDALDNFIHYTELTYPEQYRVGLGLNSTINLTDIDAQKVLFTPEQYSIIKAQYQFTCRDHSKLHTEFKSKLAIINAKINDHDLKSAYKQTRELEIDTQDDTTSRLYAIYAHIIRVYIERSDILSGCSKNGTILKLWGEIFEILFGGKKEIYLRWGETTADFTIEQTKLNNPANRNPVNFKVDCRAVAYLANDESDIDMTNMEAAKEYQNEKISQDRIKLIVEAKGTLDLFLNSSNISQEKKSKLVIPIIRITASKCELCCYRLVADGLYALDSIGSLSVAPVHIDFTENSHAWFKLLIRLKNMVLDLYDGCALLQKKNTNNFNTTVPSESPFSSFTRGTFSPPTEASPIPLIPSNLYHPACPPLNDTLVENGI